MPERRQDDIKRDAAITVSRVGTQRTGRMILFRIVENASLIPLWKLATEAVNISSCVTRSHAIS